MEIILNNNLLNVKCVMNSKDIQKGMMNRKFSKNFDGMLFLMKGNNHSFWMKDCVIPLDIIFIEENRVSKIHRNCEPCKEEPCKRYKGVGDMVLEVRGGFCKEYDIQNGDILVFND
jgi:uncharacterized membrane protein (UPF0127 family)